MKFGVELEVAGRSIASTAAHLVNNKIETATPGYGHQQAETWKVVPDGSVTGGCEIVSPVLDATNGGLDDLARVAATLTSRDDGTKFRATRKCGFHVHVDATDLTADDVKNVVRRYMRFEREIDAFMAPSRRGDLNTYCKSNASLFARYSNIRGTFESATTKLELTDAFRTRYLKVNIQSLRRHGTIEFRQHAGTIRQKRIMNWTRFLLEFVTASTVSTASTTTDSDITPTGNNPPKAPRGKLGRALAMMSEGPTTRDQIGRELGWNDKVVRTVIHRLRSRGYRIIRTSGVCGMIGDNFSPVSHMTVSYYSVVRTATSVESANTAETPDTLFRGISPDLVQYYNQAKDRYAAMDNSRSNDSGEAE